MTPAPPELEPATFHPLQAGKTSPVGTLIPSSPLTIDALICAVMHDHARLSV
jgi:hypothetical protein